MTAYRRHWPEYAMEGALLGAFMAAACGFTTLLEHPGSTLRQALPEGVRRAAMGLAMGAMAVTLVRSPWGRQSGAHMNPALTLTYLRLRKIAASDAAGYVAGQFIGGVAGVLAVRLVLGMLAAHPSVRFAVTTPGPAGAAVAFVAEAAISAFLVLVILVVSNDERWSGWTPWCCGALVAAYIALEAPLSGMSMNPARSFASAVGSGQWSALWIYLTAPPLGMLVAAELYVRTAGLERVRCAKLEHRTTRRCIFRCRA
jgi:aquaporin Z